MKIQTEIDRLRDREIHLFLAHSSFHIVSPFGFELSMVIPDSMDFALHPIT